MTVAIASRIFGCLRLALAFQEHIMPHLHEKAFLSSENTRVGISTHALASRWHFEWTSLKEIVKLGGKGKQILLASKSKRVASNRFPFHLGCSGHVCVYSRQTLRLHHVTEVPWKPSKNDQNADANATAKRSGIAA